MINGMVERLAPQLRSVYALRLLLDPYVLATMARAPFLQSLLLDDHCQTYFGGLDDFVTAVRRSTSPRSLTSLVLARSRRSSTSTSACRRGGRW